MGDRAPRRKQRSRSGGAASPEAPRKKRVRALTGTALVADLRRRLKVADALLTRSEHLVGELSTHREELQAQNEALARAEHDLWAVRDRLTDLFEQAPIPYLTLNGAAVIAACNGEAARFVGRRPDAMVGTPFARFVVQGDRPRFRQHIAACRRVRQASHVHVTLAIPAGQVPVSLSSILTNDDWIYTAVIDLRERAQAQRERQELIVRAEASRAASDAKDQFLAALSHELRTPLTPVLAAVSALEHTCASAGVKTDDLFRVVRRNLSYEVRLIDDLLDVTRLTHGKLTLDIQPVDLHRVVHEGLDLVRVDAEKKGVHLRTQLDAARAIVRGDADRLLQVFANLLGNAIKFTPGGGEVAVLSRNQRGSVHVAVRDNGVGLDPADTQRIFDRFVQGMNSHPREGLGLGLPIAHGIVTAHGGELAVSSPGPGRGTTFEVRLRCAEHASVSAPAKATAPATPATHVGSARILFVEDHEDTARLMTEVLEQAGHHVTAATSVGGAMAHADAPMDLVVSDIGLPDGSGLDLMRMLVARRGRLPGIALSGYGTREDISRSRSAGFDRHLVKPVDVTVLLQAIDDLHPLRAAGSPVRRRRSVARGAAH